jgi:hypothetical protein
MTSFRTSRSLLGPSWLTSEGESGLVGQSLDEVKDQYIQRMRDGLNARLPQNNRAGTVTAGSDALAQMGRDRRVLLGFNESNASYAKRLLRWLDDRQRAGNPFMLLQKLAEYTGAGPSFRTVDNSGNWYSRAADGTETVLINQANWDWDGGTTLWSRFWPIIYPNGLWTAEPNAWGSASLPRWGDRTKTLGLTMPHQVVTDLRLLVRDWGTGGTICPFIIVAFGSTFDPSSPEPDGNWGTWSRYVSGTRVPTRLASARFISLDETYYSPIASDVLTTEAGDTMLTEAGEEITI